MIFEFKCREFFKIKQGKLWIKDEELFIELDGIAEKIDLNKITALNIQKSGFYKFVTLSLNINYYENFIYEVGKEISIKFDYIEDIYSSEIGTIFRIIKDNIVNPNLVEAPIHKVNGNKYFLCDKNKFNNLFMN